jgi:hypothetical protein
VIRRTTIALLLLVGTMTPGAVALTVGPAPAAAATSSGSTGTSSSGTAPTTSAGGSGTSSSSSGSTGTGTGTGTPSSGSGTSGTGTGTPSSGSGSASTGSGPTSTASYWLAAADGGIFAFGGLPFYGSMGGHHLNEPIVGMAPAPGGTGYWEVASDGGIFAFGSAPFYGSMGGQHLNKPIVGMTVDPATGGYWLVASDGGIFAFHAPFYGSTGDITLNKPIVGMAATPDGGGYWLVASDGGIFAFGNAQFYGSTGNITLNKPIVAMAATPDGGGYWLVASDGGIFTFGDAPFEGSLGGDPLTYPIVAMASTGVSDTGYWLTNANGAVSSFGTAGNFGSAPQHLQSPIVAIVDGPGTGAVTDTAAPSGSFGYDVSNYQCGDPLPSGHTIGIVQATGWGGSAPNPCLSTEAAWAGGGLQLYIFMADGTSTTNEPGCDDNTACNFGFQAAQSAFEYVQAQQVPADVPWWIDVEPANWSQDTAANDQVINGALIELRGQGINTVGIYTSPLTWASIAGSYQPPVPVWLAWYTNQPQQNCSTGMSYAASNGDMLPTGGILMTQYSDDVNGSGFDGDYVC